MRVDEPTRHVRRRRRAGVGMVVALILLVANTALAQPLDLDEAERRQAHAQERREQLQRDLDGLLSRIEALKVAREEQAAEIERLDGEVRAERALADRAAARVAERYKQAYISGTGGDPLVLMFGGDDPGEVTERARLLNILARDSQEEREAAQGAAARSAALSDELEAAAAAMDDRTDQLAAAQREASEKVAQAQADVDRIGVEIEAERQRRAEERRREREAAQREAAQAAEAAEAADEEPPEPSPDGGGSAPVSGGIACPVGTPRSYSDTYGAPRSGGRSHLGVDILSPMGTPIYAYEDGVITRMNNSSLGGISLYLQGDSGNQYFYTHLSGYMSGVSAGDRVTAGQHIAHNGDSGNAAGIPHLHFEVRPGGGANVNPYPYAFRACG